MVTASLPAAALRLVVGGTVLFRNAWSGGEEFGSQRFGSSTCLPESPPLTSKPLYRLWEGKGRDNVGICMKISYNFSRNYTQERQLGKLGLFENTFETKVE